MHSMESTIARLQEILDRIDERVKLIESEKADLKDVVDAFNVIKENL